MTTLPKIEPTKTLKDGESHFQTQNLLRYSRSSTRPINSNHRRSCIPSIEYPRSHFNPLSQLKADPYALAPVRAEAGVSHLTPSDLLGHTRSGGEDLYVATQSGHGPRARSHMMRTEQGGETLRLDTGGCISVTASSTPALRRYTATTSAATGSWA
jgi:hypothetical protein